MNESASCSQLYLFYHIPEIRNFLMFTELEGEHELVIRRIDDKEDKNAYNKLRKDSLVIAIQNIIINLACHNFSKLSLENKETDPVLFFKNDKENKNFTSLYDKYEGELVNYIISSYNDKQEQKNKIKIKIIQGVNEIGNELKGDGEFNSVLFIVKTDIEKQMQNEVNEIYNLSKIGNFNLSLISITVMKDDDINTANAYLIRRLNEQFEIKCSKFVKNLAKPDILDNKSSKDFFKYDYFKGQKKQFNLIYYVKNN